MSGQLYQPIHWTNVYHTNSLSLLGVNSTIVFSWAKSLGLCPWDGSSEVGGRDIPAPNSTDQRWGGICFFFF